MRRAGAARSSRRNIWNLPMHLGQKAEGVDFNSVELQALQLFRVRAGLIWGRVFMSPGI